MSRENYTEWIISGNPKEYRVIEAFRELRKLDWRQSKKANINVGDIVYVFVSEGIWAIRLKCRVNKTNIEVPDIDDHEYVLKERSGGSADRYMELELMEEYDGEEYSKDELKKHGFGKSPQNPVRMPASVKDYMESIRESGQKTDRKAIKALEERGVFREMKEANKEFDKNLILYGPPGTGKTYNSATYAVAICDNKSVDELTDYDAVMARYNELKKAGRIAFTTFHQSYGYEEFIEGIKPVVDDSKQDVGYTIEAGIFKQFCEDAKSAGHKTGDAVIDAGARIWKLTIMNGDLNQVKQECFEENNVRMGFGMEADEARSFVEDVRIGDIILSFKIGRAHV